MQTSGKLRSLRAENSLNSRDGLVLPSSKKAPTSAKSDVGWRFAPACCAAQSVLRARRRSAVQRSAPARCLGSSGVQNQFVSPRYRAGGAMQFHNQRLFRTSTTPRKLVAQFRCGASNKLLLASFLPIEIAVCLANQGLTGVEWAHNLLLSSHQ